MLYPFALNTYSVWQCYIIVSVCKGMMVGARVCVSRVNMCICVCTHAMRCGTRLDHVYVRIWLGVLGDIVRSTPSCGARCAPLLQRAPFNPIALRNRAAHIQSGITYCERPDWERERVCTERVEQNSSTASTFYIHPVNGCNVWPQIIPSLSRHDICGRIFWRVAFHTWWCK